MEIKKIYTDPNVDKHLIPASEKYNDSKMEMILGVGLNMPFESMNSAARKTMFYSQYQQRVNLCRPDFPLISTGYENEFGCHSSGYVESKENWTVVARFEKFPMCPGHHYYLIVMNNENKLDLIERISYHYNTETYGYTFDNTIIDSVSNVGDVIEVGTTIRKPSSMDKYNNYRTGRNLLVSYIANTATTEDAIQISESAKMKLARSEVKKITIELNDNEIPLNLYGTDTNYKIFPDIGEKITNGILFGKRIENRNEAFFTQSAKRLKSPMINDTTYKSEGTIIDIDVYCNKCIADSTNYIYESQIEYYSNMHKDMCKNVVDTLRMYIDNSDYDKSYELSRFYNACEDVVMNKQYIRDDKIFSNIIIDVYIYHEAPVEEGDKIAGRSGGKGVISEITPDELMPRTPDGKIVDLVWNIATCVNRENPNQLFEMSLNFISSKLIQYIDSKAFDVQDYVDMIYRYFGIISPTYADEFMTYIEDTCETDEEVMYAINEFIHEDADVITGLYICIEPISEVMTFEKLILIYQEFSWIAPTYPIVPIVGSRGNIRYVNANKPSIIAAQYIYRMKQNAEEKHSSTAMSAINVRGENSKSKAYKQGTRKFASTPIKQGEMETVILHNANAEKNVINMMLHSTSPQGRRCAAQLLTGDPKNIDVHLDASAKSRSVEKLTAIFKCMGIEVKHSKTLIVYDNSIFKFHDSMNDELFKFQDYKNNELFKYQDYKNDCLFKYNDYRSDELFKFQDYENPQDSVFKFHCEVLKNGTN